MPLQKRVIKNIPKTEAEILNSRSEPSYGDKPPIHEYKRAEDVSIRGEDLKDISVGL